MVEAMMKGVKANITMNATFVEMEAVRIFVITFSLFTFILHSLLSVSNNLFLPVTKDLVIILITVIFVMMEEVSSFNLFHN